ncbi:MAG TPA: 30S ribosomal protein S16 [Vicinamibacteria bacterium]|jgi:small subunit ribosomal protein S16
MLRIRLARRGGNKRPQYRVVVSDSTHGRGGAIVENVGTYEPKSGQRKVELKRDRIEYWIGKGASATDTVRSLIKNNPA